MIRDQGVAAPARAGVPITIAGVTKHYRTARGGDVHALSEIDLAIAAGEFVSIVGPSGCGKSTLLMLVAGLIPPTAGAIEVGGARVGGAVGNVAIVCQRVAICRALVQDPGLLLMDEPFGALDALTREQMNLDLQRMWLRDRNTVLFITHSIEEAVLLSDRVVVMSSRPGRIADIVTNELPRPRGAHTRSEPGFVEHVERIRRHFLALGVLSET